MWISSKREDSTLINGDKSLESSHPKREPKPKKENPTNLRPPKVFQRKFSKRDKEAIVMPLTHDAPLDDTTCHQMILLALILRYMLLLYLLLIFLLLT